MMEVDTTHEKIASKISSWAAVLTKYEEKIIRLDVGYGKGGIALFFLYKYLSFKQEEDGNTFFYLLQKIIESIDPEKQSSFFAIELTEIAFLLNEYQSEINQAFDVNDVLAQLDPFLESLFVKFFENNNIDPYSGGFYQGAYLLNYSDKYRTQVAEYSLTYLEKHQRSDKNGGFLVNINPTQPNIYLGNTHGVAYAILFTVNIYQRGLFQERCLPLIKGWVTFLINQKQNYKELGSFFPNVLHEKEGSKLYICYGDLGIILALYRAALILEDTDLLADVEDMIQVTYQRRSTQETKGNSILYGSAGIYLFYRYFQLEYNSVLGNETLAFWEKQYINDVASIDTKNINEKSLSFLEGITGQMSVLMGAKVNRLPFEFLLNF